jgi:O-antigen/teichoic acid export membrane protein
MSGFALYYWSEAFQLSRRTGQRALLMLAPGAVQLALTVWLSSEHGAVGAAIGAAAGASIGAVLLALAGRRLLPLPFAAGELARILAATTIMAGGVIAFPGAHTTFGLFQSATLGVGLYAASAVALNVFGVRVFAIATAQAALRRLQPHSSPANAE